MARVITFSRVFPTYHPKKGQPTFFVEKVYKSLFLMKCVSPDLANDFNFAVMNDENYSPKHHTIRKGNRWKAGDKFSPRVWSGKPYASKQITIAPDIEIKKIWDIQIHQSHEIFINGKFFASFASQNCALLAQHDGLNIENFQHWFNKLPFIGQIICWSEQIQY
jgi:hypothetical protein